MGQTLSDNVFQGIICHDDLCPSNLYLSCYWPELTNFLWPRIFWDFNLFGAKIFLDPKIFLKLTFFFTNFFFVKIFYRPTIFLEPTICLPKNLLDSKFIGTQNLLGLKIYLNNKTKTIFLGFDTVEINLLIVKFWWKSHIFVRFLPKVAIFNQLWDFHQNVGLSKIEILTKMYDFHNNSLLL